MPRIKPGPGAGKYNLPPLTGYVDHDITKYRNPQYSIRIPLPTHYKSLGPGPKYQVERMNMYGKEHPPAYSVVPRRTDLKPFHTPGPAAYNLGDVPRMKEARPPAYSLKFRQKPLKRSETPGPNRYQLPTTIGPKVPDLYANGAFTMRTKPGLKENVRSPGPARYDPIPPNQYKLKQPIYTIPIQTKTVTDKGPRPAPNAYLPKHPKCGYRGFSFGLRTDTDPYIIPEDAFPCVNKQT